MTERTRASIYCIAGVALCLLSSGSQAAMYKWVDEDGITHYTQQPPPAGIEGETMNPSTGNASDSKEAEKRRQQYLEDLSGESEGKEKQKQEKTQKGPSKEELKKVCDKARARLKSFQNPRVNYVAEDGSRRRATEEERQRELAKTREYIKKNCQ